MRELAKRLEDELLWLECRRGGEEAFRHLLAVYEQPLFYYLRRLLDREEDAWDALQEVWIKAFKGVGRLRDGGSFGPWLYRIARNTAFNRTRLAPAERWAQEPGEEAAGPGEGAAVLTGGFSARDVHRTLARLPLIEREVLTLHFLEGYEVREIAEVTQVPEGTVKSRLHRARRLMREILEEEIHA